MSNYILSSGALPTVISDKIGQLKGADIKAKSARAVVALSIGTVAGRSMRFIRSMILARILAPNQIGIMAIVMSFSIAFEALTEVGVKQSIIQNKQGANTRYLNVAWWMQVTRALCLFGIAVLLAPWISSFYDNPELIQLLRVAFIAIALRGFVSPRAHVLEKEYKFGRAVFLIQGSAILGAIISIGLALVMRNVWALVIGFVIEMAILCILSFIIVPFMPRFEIDKSSLAELMKFARGMFGLPILTALSFQAPILILGKVISKDQLGLYSYAALLSYIPVDLYIRTIAPVVLPAFSEKQDDKNALCRGVLRTTRWTACFVIPLAAFMACCASELLLFAYGPKYVAMAIPLAVLCLQIVVRNQAVSLASVYLAVGQPHLQRRFAIIRAVAIIGLMYPAAVRFGPLGVAVVIVLSNFAVLLMQVFKARKVIDLELSRYVRSYIPGLLLALPIIMTAGLLWVFRVDSSLFVLAISTLVFIVTFAVSVLIMNRPKETLQSRNNLRIS
ncbi:oligosaccharide flippase family protein [bacterium]|nr:oligosaccharide flippase family protein [bacterium]